MTVFGIPRIFFPLIQSNKIALFFTSAIIVTMMVDISIARVYDLVVKQPTSIWKVIAFVIITCICVIGQYFILGFVNRKSPYAGHTAKLQVRIAHHAARISQYGLTVILAILILQITLTSHYYTVLIITVVWISYVLAIFMLGLLAQRFFSWSASNKSLMTILYALASVSLAVNAGFTLIYVSDILADRPLEMKPFSAGSMVSIPLGSTTATLNSGFFVSSVASFALLWAATAVLLYHYSVKLGRMRYWMIIASPLVLFLSQFASFYVHLFDPLMGSDPVSFTILITLVFTLSKPIGGLLFGLAFYTLAQSFKQNIAIRNYLIISAVGFVLIYVANQASVLLVAPFPPFGVPSVAFVGLASFLILLGIYSSVISISEDARLRRLLRKTAHEQFKLLDSMATAHMKDEIQKKVVKVMRENSDKMIELAGLQSLPSEDDLKGYVDEVIKEIIVHKEKRSGATKSFPEKEL